MKNNVKEINIELYIDYNLLKIQKKCLLDVIELVNNEETKEHLTGLLGIIDSIQDHAVEELGMDENIIFDF